MKIRAVLLSAVAVTIIVTMWTRDPHTPQTSPAAASASSTPTSTQATTSASTSDTGTDEVGAGEQYGTVTDERALNAAARGFATDFAETGPGWAARVGQWCVASLTDRLATVDTANIPAAGALDRVTVTDPSEPIAHARAWYTSGLQLQIMLIYDPLDGWKILTYEKVAS